MCGFDCVSTGDVLCEYDDCVTTGDVLCMVVTVSQQVVYYVWL